MAGRADPDKGMGKLAFDEKMNGEKVAWVSIDPAASVGWHLQVDEKHWSGKADPGNFISKIPWEEAEGRKFIVTIERAFYGDTTQWGVPKCRTCGQAQRKKFGGAGRTGAVTMIETQGWCVCEVARKLQGRLLFGMWRPIAASWRPKIGYPNRRAEAKALAMADFKKKFGRYADSDDEAEAFAITRAAQAARGQVFDKVRSRVWHEVKG